MSRKALLVAVAVSRPSGGGTPTGIGRALVARLSVRDSRPVRGRVNLSGWAFILFMTLVAELGVRLLDLEDSVAAPSSALRALGEGLLDGTLSSEVVTTIDTYAQGLAIAVVVGVVAGVLIGSSRLLLDASWAVIEFLRPIPAVVLIPAAVLYFGLDVPMRRFVVAFAAVWPILVNTIYGVRGTDPFLHDVARVSGVGRGGRLVRVTLPAALPSIVTGIRVGASLALLVCVTAEFVIGTGGGLGSYMQQQRSAVRLPEMYAAVIVVGFLGYLVNACLRAAEHRLVFWVGDRRKVGV